MPVPASSLPPTGPTFQQAVNVVDPGGEVTAIDSAGFGPINITKSVSITSPDGVEAGIVAPVNGVAIDINIGLSDAVVLRRLTLDGAHVASNGIVLNSGGSLIVTNCVAQNFHETIGQTQGNGILIQPTFGTTKFVITNMVVANNDGSGILYLPPSGSPITYGVIDHVTAFTNNIGIRIDSSSGATGGSAVVAVSNSVTETNSGYGLYADNGKVPLTVSIDNTLVVGNKFDGVLGMETSAVLLGRSVILGNESLDIHDNMNSKTIYTYKDNRLNVGINGPVNSLPLQ
jgi:hypothetical protein